MLIKTYTKKPVQIKAIQLTEETLSQTKTWIEENGYQTRYFERPKVNLIEGLMIETLEGIMIASFGDYVIQGIQGEFYPCKEDIFLATYTEENQ